MTSRVLTIQPFRIRCLAFTSFPTSTHRSTDLISQLSLTRIPPRIPLLYSSRSAMTVASAAIPVDADVPTFIESFNAAYERMHKAYEDNFWATKMNLNGSSSAELTRTKNELDLFLGDEKMLERVREHLKRSDLTAEQRKVLAIFERTFLCYIIQDQDALALRNQINELEAELAQARNKMQLGYVDPVTKEYKSASSVQLRNLMRTSPNEELRKACYEGLRGIGPFVAEKFVEICFYDMKVSQAEGFGKHTLFPMLEKLEKDSRPILEASLARLAKEKGESALLPYNLGYSLSGDISALKDPYFPFENALLVFQYEGATMRLDLCDRQGKYSNGFCHWPQPAWKSSTRGWVPSQANFTSLATPSQIGSGHTALVTLMHEGGHAAHFANVQQASPLFSQERAPTSIPYAENQSMFLDSIVKDGAWLGRYALSVNGEVIPWDLVERDITSTHPYEVFALRAMIAVPFFERRLYDLDESELTPARMLAIADEIEKDIQGVRRLLPRLRLADMSVHQTRKHFLSKYGAIVDNEKVGADLREIYWKSGNSRMFLDLVKEMTGKDLSGDAWVESLKEPLEERLEAVRVGPKYAAGDKVGSST
ncbi:metalloendopeptidase [Chytridium lagenaria]|nr:metalloendopeptidase [Chytridium lagenaria]